MQMRSCGDVFSDDIADLELTRSGMLEAWFEDQFRQDTSPIVPV